MTTQARVVLSDCQGALDSLAHCEHGAEWRRRWVTVVTLQRAVGHVLDKVDGTSSPRMASVIKTRWSLLNKTKPEPHIFWNFIEEERNNVLKEYLFAGRHASGFNVKSVSLSVGDGKIVTSTAEESDEIHMHVFNEGPFAGRHQIDVAAEAIAWWKAYLDEIDKATAEPLPLDGSERSSSS
jgi:hypothetical protein